MYTYNIYTYAAYVRMYIHNIYMCYEYTYTCTIYVYMYVWHACVMFICN